MLLVLNYVKCIHGINYPCLLKQFITNTVINLLATTAKCQCRMSVDLLQMHTVISMNTLYEYDLSLIHI